MNGTEKRLTRRKPNSKVKESEELIESKFLGTSGESDDGEITPITPPILQTKGKFSSLYVRTLSGAAFVIAFVGIIYLGHVYCLALIIGLQFLITKELFDLARATARKPMNVEQENRELPGFRMQQWYIFGVVSFYMYGKLLQDIMVHEVSTSSLTTKSEIWKFVKWITLFVLKKHGLISYFLYLFGFVMSVLSLKKGKYMYQFSQYAWTITIILFVLVQTSFFVSNIFDGLIWFVLPCALVVTNDIMAFFMGKCFGKTPLINLSPKKTLEGFIGGGLITTILSVPLTQFLSSFEWMICSRTALAYYKMECRKPEMYLPTLYRVTDFIPHWLAESWIPGQLLSILDTTTCTMKPIIIHGVILAIFASLIAPFGGFFASGIKRALKIKDFGSSIPGHGGLTDRMDCQCVMGLFAYIYLHNFVTIYNVSVTSVLDKVLLLEPEQQLVLFTRLGYLLAGQDQLPITTISELNKLPV